MHVLNVSKALLHAERQFVVFSLPNVIGVAGKKRFELEYIEVENVG